MGSKARTRVLFGGEQTLVLQALRHCLELCLLAEGKVMREIGDELGITTRTVVFHKYRMMETLGVRSTAELLQLAVREHMIGQRIEG